MIKVRQEQKLEDDKKKKVEEEKKISEKVAIVGPSQEFLDRL